MILQDDSRTRRLEAPETTPKTTRGPSPEALGPSLLGRGGCDGLKVHVIGRIAACCE